MLHFFVLRTACSGAVSPGETIVPSATVHSWNTTTMDCSNVHEPPDSPGEQGIEHSEASTAVMTAVHVWVPGS